MNTLIQYERIQKRPLRIDLKPNGELWFVAKDVAEMLDIQWQGKKTLDALDEDEWVVGSYHTTQMNQHGESGTTEKDTYFINESGLYKLSFRSNKPAAKQFTNWVTREVLPSIRQTGGYSLAPSYLEKVSAINELLWWGDRARMCRELGIDTKKAKRYLTGKMKRPQMDFLEKMHTWARTHSSTRLDFTQPSAISNQ